jgi:hypothetical protein
MRMTSSSSQPVKKGYALIMVMIFLAATALVLGSVMLWTNSNGKQVKRSNIYYTSQAAAEAAVEQVIANMNRDYLYQAINPASSYTNIVPSTNGWPIPYVFSSPAGVNRTYVKEGATSTNLQPLGSQWSGLSGYPTTVTVTSTATPKNQLYNVPATVTETNVYADIPLFQFAIFYNMNLEVQPGSGMNIGGPVFCNDSIWTASPMTYSNSVTAGGTISSNNISDPFMTAGSKTGSGNPTFMGGIATNHATLTLPIGASNSATSVEAVLQLPPSGNTSSTYLYNQADLIITNSSSGTNVKVFYQNTNNAPTLTSIPYDGAISSYVGTNGYTTNYNTTTSKKNGKTTTVTNSITYTPIPITIYTTNKNAYSFVTSTNFYDYREGKTVSAIYLDVSNLDVWINGAGSTYNNQNISDTGKNINSIYIYNSVPMNSSTLPGVQVDNGAQLPPDGLGIATPDPIYVVGNFNSQTSAGNDAGSSDVTYTKPAALYADALTVLSDSWNDTNYTSSTSLSSRPPVPTTINAAALEGIVPSTGTHYSGGAENFLRLLENWSNTIQLTYNGSIVVMFPSQYATNMWNGNVYGVPKRQWNFDANFTQAGGLPPMTPRVKAIIRQGWTP